MSLAAADWKNAVADLADGMLWLSDVEWDQRKKTLRLVIKKSQQKMDCALDLFLFRVGSKQVVGHVFTFEKVDAIETDADSSAPFCVARVEATPNERVTFVGGDAKRLTVSGQSLQVSVVSTPPLRKRKVIWLFPFEFEI